MKGSTIMIVAGDPSGDGHAADLIHELRRTFAEPLIFMGAGGPKMAGEGVPLEFDLTADAVIGLGDVVRKLPLFRRRFKHLLQLALARQPDLIMLVDFSGFNRRLAHAIREATRRNRALSGWDPKIVQYVSPQVWASRPTRADKMAADFDLLLCLFPFEKEWYAKRLPNFRVECIGHPMFDKFGKLANPTSPPEGHVLLLPGSRAGELKRHVPVMVEAARQLQAQTKVEFKMALPNDRMADLAKSLLSDAFKLEIVVGGLEKALQWATIAIASTGTVTLECAFFGVPTVAIYKTSWSTYTVGRQIIQVKYLAMPNLLADEAIFPEFIQSDATSANISRAAAGLLRDKDLRLKIRTRLGKIIDSLGGPGSSRRAAEAIRRLLIKA